jgi:hypothetical protein
VAPQKVGGRIVGQAGAIIFATRGPVRCGRCAPRCDSNAPNMHVHVIRRHCEENNSVKILDFHSIAEHLAFLQILHDSTAGAFNNGSCAQSCIENRRANGFGRNQ